MLTQLRKWPCVSRVCYEFYKAPCIRSFKVSCLQNTDTHPIHNQPHSWRLIRSHNKKFAGKGYKHCTPLLTDVTPPHARLMFWCTGVIWPDALYDSIYQNHTHISHHLITGAQQLTGQIVTNVPHSFSNGVTRNITNVSKSTNSMTPVHCCWLAYNKCSHDTLFTSVHVI